MHLAAITWISPGCKRWVNIQRTVRVHDLRHTFGQRLRYAGVSFEDRQDLLGHKSDRITTHYSAPEYAQLLAAANSICEQKREAVLRLVEAKRGQ